MNHTYHNYKQAVFWTDSLKQTVQRNQVRKWITLNERPRDELIDSSELSRFTLMETILKIHNASE